MNGKHFLFFSAVIIALFLTSCASSPYYQIYKANPKNSQVKNNNLVYEDENCRVSYNLWEQGGNFGFVFYNKTNTNIYLNLEESFFILNGIAYDYYKNRVFTSSENSATTSVKSSTFSNSVTGLNYLGLLQTNNLQSTSGKGLVASSGFSTSYNEEKVICIPSKTSKIITEYKITESLFRDCDLYKYPTKSQIKTKTFSEESSPIVFSNRLAYTIEKSENLTRFENEFYISEISNYPESEIFEQKYDEYCGKRRVMFRKYFKNVSPDKFYIKYTKGQDTQKH